LEDDDGDRLFVDWVREVMAARRLTQRQVARLAGIHHSSLSRLLGGERVKLSYATARRLYRALERDAEEPLLERTFLGDADAQRRGGAIDVPRC
jgi:transcriptional regulator with XRE-family HTH domain